MKVTDMLRRVLAQTDDKLHLFKQLLLFNKAAT